MARRRKTGLHGTQWRELFKQAAEYCKANRGAMKYQQCVAEYLKAAEGKLIGVV